MNDAYAELAKHDKYGPIIREFFKKVDVSKLMAFVLAIAKVESGEQIGTFSVHRYEPKKKVFSYSFFHILMQKAGLRARVELNMTEGMCLEPKGSVKLFFAYLIEMFSDDKKDGDPEKHGFVRDLSKTVDLRRADNCEKVATFYNGSGYEENKYDKKIHKLYMKAIAQLS